jgi:hypothetical protein
MSDIFLISFYYIFVGGLFMVFFYFSMKNFSRGVGATFINLSIFYYFLFFYIPFYYVVTGHYLKTAGFSLDFYFMSFYYSVVLVLLGIIINLLTKRRTTVHLQTENSSNNEYISYYFIALLVLIKIGLAVIELTPLQLYLFYGDFQGAHVAQKILHKSGNLSFLKIFYNVLGPVIAVIFLFKAARERNLILKLLLLFLAIETAGWYFSKSRIALVIITYLMVTNSPKRILPLLIALPIVVYFSFALRLNTFTDYQYIFEHIMSRAVLETGYSLIHYELIKGYSPPLGYFDRYYIGFRTLFGIEAIGNWSKEAYLIETGKYGATTSGYAPVNLYAFFGMFWFLFLPLFFSFIAFIEIKFSFIWKRSYFLFISYIFLSLMYINSLTVDITRVLDFRFIFNPYLIMHVSFIFLVYRFLVVRRFKYTLKVGV